MKILFTLILTTFYLLLSTSLALAQSATGSASPSPETINRIQEAINKNLKNTETVLSESSSRLVGYAGTVSDIKEGVLTLESGTTTLQVTLTAQTTIIKDGKTIKAELISVKDKVIVIGQLTAPEVLSAKRIVIYKETFPIYTKKIIFSPIAKVGTNSLILNIDGNDETVYLGKKLNLDLKILSINQKIFGIVMIDAKSGKITLIQAKIIEVKQAGRSKIPLSGTKVI